MKLFTSIYLLILLKLFFSLLENLFVTYIHRNSCSLNLDFYVNRDYSIFNILPQIYSSELKSNLLLKNKIKAQNRNKNYSENSNNNSNYLQMKSNSKEKTNNLLMTTTTNAAQIKAHSKKFLIKNTHTNKMASQLKSKKSSLNHLFKVNSKLNTHVSENNSNSKTSELKCELNLLNFSYQNTITFPEFLFGTRRLHLELKPSELKLIYKFIDSRNQGYFSSKRWNQFYAFFLNEFLSCDTNKNCLLEDTELVQCINNNEDLHIVKDTLPENYDIELLSKNIVQSLDYNFVNGINFHGFLSFKRAVIGFRESEISGILDQETFRKGFKTAFSSMLVDNFDIDLVYHTGYFLLAKNITDFFYDFPQFFEICRLTNNFMNYGVSIAEGYLTEQDTVRDNDFPSKITSDFFKRYYSLFETESIAVTNYDFATSVDPTVIRFQDYVALEYWANIFTNYTETSFLTLQRMNKTGFGMFIKEGLKREYQSYIAYSNFMDETSLKTDNYLINTTDYEFLMNIGSFIEKDSEVTVKEIIKESINQEVMGIIGKKENKGNNGSDGIKIDTGFKKITSTNEENSNNANNEIEAFEFLKKLGQPESELKKQSTKTNDSSSNININSGAKGKIPHDLSNIINKDNKNSNPGNSVFNKLKTIQETKLDSQQHQKLSFKANSNIQNEHNTINKLQNHHLKHRTEEKSKQGEKDLSSILEKSIDNFYKLLDLHDDEYIYFEAFISLTKYLQVYKQMNAFNADPRGILKTDCVNSRNDIIAHPPLTIYEKNKISTLDSFNCNFMDFLFFMDYMFAPVVFKPYVSNLYKDFVEEAYLVLGLKKLNLNIGDSNFPPFPHVNRKGNNYDYETAVYNGLMKKCTFNTALYQYKVESYNNQLDFNDALPSSQNNFRNFNNFNSFNNFK